MGQKDKETKRPKYKKNNKKRLRQVNNFFRQVAIM